MTSPEGRSARTRHPTLWTVEAVRWEYRKESDEGPTVQLGEGLAAAEVSDRGVAIAIAHHFLDRHADEAAGRMSLEVHLHPPEQDVEGEDQCEASDEVLEQPEASAADPPPGRPRKRR